MMSEYQEWKVTEPYLDLHCSLGEGPYYEAEHNVLRFLDIIKKRLHTIDLSIGPSSLQTLQLDMPLGVTADVDGIDSSKKILACGKSGVYLLERETGKLELLKRYHDSTDNDERLRGNDGAIDPEGRLWIATMNDFWVGEPKAEGNLFRFDGDLSRSTHLSNLVIPNGLGWSQDRKTQYFTNTTENRIVAWDYDAITGDLSNERTFWKHDGPGSPDGFKMDVEGNFWQAIYGGSCVLKISPEGKVIGKVTYPTEAITCPVFVGTELWVTSADETDEKDVNIKKYAGGVFKVDVGIKGAKETPFKLKR